MRHTSIRVLFAAWVATLGLLGCGGDDESPAPGRDDHGDADDGGDTPELSVIDVVGARALFIADAPGTSNALSHSHTTLFKITDSGAVEEVTYVGEDGQETTVTNAPVAIYDADATYVIICFGQDEWNLQSCYLVRKTDGAAFTLANAGLPVPQPNNFASAPVVQTDAAGNLYYCALSQVHGAGGSLVSDLVKLDVQDPEQITRTVYSPSEEHVEHFFVDPSGHAAYSGRLKSDMSGASAVRRIRKANGGLYNLPAETWAYWIGPSGKITYHVGGGDRIQEVTIDANANVSVADYGTVDVTTFFLVSYSSFKIEVADRIIIINRNDNRIYEVQNPAQTPREIIGLPIATIKRVVADASRYYLSGNDSSAAPVLLRVDAATDAPTSLLAPGDYDIYEMAVSPAGVLTFSALRMHDGAKVIGEIAADGTVTVLDATLDSQVTVLERIK